MKAIESQNYNQEFPETFTWGHIESIALTNIAYQLTAYIEHDLRTPDRNYVPGLRAALNEIAKYAKI